MSQTEENIESTLQEDDSLWGKFKKIWLNDYSNFIDDREDQDEKVVRIAVIGKTRVGKGSFINAIRAIKKSREIGEKGPDKFEIQGPSANVTDGILPGPLIIEKYEYLINENPVIYFYDTGGFGDAINKNYNLEEELKKYQIENKIKFDAIIFMIDSNNFVEGELMHLKVQENKVCLVLYVGNQIDVLKFKIKNEEKFDNEKKKLKQDILKIFNTNDVNKYSHSEKDIYLISSNLSDFEDEDVSPDGKRIKAELTKLLVNIKIGEPLDLFNSFTKRLISYKAKFIQDKVSKKAYDSAFLTSWTAIIPFADIFMQNKVVSDYKDVFLNQFGIKPVIDFIEKNEDIENSNLHFIILKGTEKWERIKTLVDELNSNKMLEAINLIFKNDKSELTKEKIKSSLNQIGMLAGGLVTTFWDDIALA